MTTAKHPIHTPRTLEDLADYCRAASRAAWQRRALYTSAIEKEGCLRASAAYDDVLTKINLMIQREGV